jgi:hypothetical protein
MPDYMERKGQIGLYFGQHGIRSDYFQYSEPRADYIALTTNFNLTYAQYEKFFADKNNILKYVYENSGKSVTVGGETIQIATYLFRLINIIRSTFFTGKIPNMSFDTLVTSPSVVIAFELLLRYCYENDIQVVPYEEARRIAVSNPFEMKSNVFPNPGFSQSLLAQFGNSSTSPAAYLPDGFDEVSSNVNSVVSVSAEDGNRILNLTEYSTKVRLFGLPAGTYKFSVYAKANTAGSANIKIYTWKNGYRVDDFASALETTINVDNNSFVLKEYEFTINEPYAELPDKTDYLNVMCDGYQENVFLTEIAFDAGSTTLSLHSPKIKLV